MGNRAPFVVIAATLVLSSAATAHAQAPGETLPPPPAGPAHESVMANRWAVGLSIGGLGVAPQSASDAKSNFDVGELSLRFRATLHLEIEAAFGGGRERLSDGTQGDNQASFGTLGLRYRFMPEDPWNVWVMGALGGMTVASQSATDSQKSGAGRSLGELGVGLERRFEHFALQAELRLVTTGAQKDPTAASGGTVMVAPNGAPMPVTAATASDRLSGGQLTIGASYYF